MKRLPPVHIFNRTRVTGAVILIRRVVANERLPLSLCDFVVGHVEVIGERDLMLRLIAVTQAHSQGSPS